MSHLPIAAKLTLTALMIVGRLELYTVFVALHLIYRQVRPVRGLTRNGRSGHRPEPA